MSKQVEYIDTGVNWIGEIPSTWKSKRIKMLTRVKRGASPRPIDNPIYFDEEGEFAWVRIADVTASERYLENTTQRLSELGSSASVKRYPDDFFLSIAGSVGKPIITKIKCCIHDGFVYFPDLKINPEFLYYVFSTGLPYLGLGKLGTQLNLNTDTVGDIYIPIPNEKEIENIVSFLDLKTLEIDKIISQKQKLIECLKEERMEIINQAVTGNLSNSAKKKPSGFEWVPTIPENWTTNKIKNIAQIFGRIGYRGYQTSDLVNEGEGAITLSPSNMKEFEMDFTKCTYLSWLKYDESPEIQIENGDILFVKTGSTYGKTSFVKNLPEKATINPQLLVFKDIKINSEFFYYVLISQLIQAQVSISVIGGTIPTISQEKIGNYYLFVPPMADQTEIIEEINKHLGHTNLALIKIEQEIELIKEFRTSLINEVVTGKMQLN